MIQSANPPDALVLARTAVVVVALLYLPGRIALTRSFRLLAFESLEKGVEAVVASLIILALVSMFLVFTIGLRDWTLAASYVLLGAFAWIRLKW